jgi:hypothetical protein
MLYQFVVGGDHFAIRKMIVFHIYISLQIQKKPQLRGFERTKSIQFAPIPSPAITGIKKEAPIMGLERNNSL